MASAFKLTKMAINMKVKFIILDFKYKKYIVFKLVMLIKLLNFIFKNNNFYYEKF